MHNVHVYKINNQKQNKSVPLLSHTGTYMHRRAPFARSHTVTQYVTKVYTCTKSLNTRSR